ncbi:MAG: GNAT family N-acetyltransferase [Alphaproteobacteria bacterium]|nr:GNAT family N-acetyltransferase [Alphaproteobacteria bacterium]
MPVQEGLPAGIHIRAATPDDAAMLLDLMLRSWTGTVAGNSSAYRETEATISAQLARGGGAVICHEDEPVGAGRFHPVPGPEGDARQWVEIKRVGLLRPWRNKGLAAPLVAFLEAAAARQGYAGAQLGVRVDQPRLVAFWAGLGYSLADDVTMHTVNPLTDPPITMRKRL